MARARWRSYIEGPRWAGIGRAIKEGAVVFDVEITQFDVDKGFFSEAVFFTVEGEDQNVTRFRDGLLSSLEDYNGMR